MIVPSLATSFLLQSGIWFALVCAIVGLAAALYLIRFIFAHSPGNDRMRQIAAAIEEGAKAYLNRQIISVSIIAVVIFILLVFTRDLFTAVGFCIGAVCSMSAGYVGMRIAVISNSRTAQAATKSQESALRMAVLFNL
jgi:K(+)-stimulated pyrophosphate-energized sodium pump